MNTVLSNLQKPGIYLDIGSFTGYHSAVADFSGALEVHSFDPFLINSQKTCETCMLNEANCHVYNFIFGKENSYEHWCCPLDNYAYSIRHGCPKPNELFYENYYSQIVKIVDLTEWLHENMKHVLTPPNDYQLLIKIEVSEGYEENILKSNLKLWEHE